MIELFVLSMIHCWYDAYGFMASVGCGFLIFLAVYGYIMYTMKNEQIHTCFTHVKEYLTREKEYFTKQKLTLTKLEEHLKEIPKPEEDFSTISPAAAELAKHM